MCCHIYYITAADFIYIQFLSLRDDLKGFEYFSKHKILQKTILFQPKITNSGLLVVRSTAGAVCVFKNVCMMNIIFMQILPIFLFTCSNFFLNHT